MNDEKHIKYLRYEGSISDGHDRTVTNMRLQIELYESYLYCVLEHDMTGDEDMLVHKEFIVPYALLKSVEAYPYINEFYGDFYILSFRRFLDWRLDEVIVQEVDIPWSCQDPKKYKENVKTLVQVIKALKERLLTSKGFEIELGLFQSTRKFFTEQYGMTPEEFWVESESRHVAARYEDERFEMSLVGKYLHRRDPRQLQKLMIEGGALDYETLRCMDDINHVARIRYALGFANLEEYKQFVKADSKRSKELQKEEPLDDHDIEGIDPTHPVILLCLYGRMDTVLLHLGYGTYAAWAEFARRCDQEWRYENWIKKAEMPENLIDKLRLNRHHFGEY